jgi:transposase-like protein
VTDRLTESDIKGMIKAYLSGNTIARLAEQHGVSASSVKRLLREYGVRKHRLNGAT